MSIAVANLEEVQGLYGPYSFSEKLLQKIWLRGDFDRAAARTTTGRRVRIMHPGNWNLLGGPDFRGARIIFDDGPEISCDVELHLHAGDWAAHGHARDAAYDQVKLHVVLFPPKWGEVTQGAEGREIPVLSLLPLLHHDLEAFAADDVVEALAQRPAGRIVEELGQKLAKDLLRLLREHAAQRWRLKVHFARQRLNRLGWDAACHHAALEILGYRFNRAPMLRLAGRFPFQAWSSGAVDADQAWTAEAEAWSVQGVRPANQPRARLAQYAAWVRARPRWPTRLVEAAADWPKFPIDTDTRALRREREFTRLRRWLADEICGATLGGTRFDTLLCDAWLPLLSARTCDEQDLEGLWFHWRMGDIPRLLPEALRDLGVFVPQQPACNGFVQGLLGWYLKREATALAPLGRGA